MTFLLPPGIKGLKFSEVFWCFILRWFLNHFILSTILQKQSFVDVLQTRCSRIFCKLHRKAPVFLSFFNKTCNFLKKRLKSMCLFFVNLQNFKEHLFSYNTSSGCFCFSCRANTIWEYEENGLMREGELSTIHCVKYRNFN